MDLGSSEWVTTTHTAGLIAAQIAQLHAALVTQTATMIHDQSWVGDGVRSPEHWIQIYTGLSPAQANAIVRVAKRASELSLTVEWMHAGRISLDQADIIASRAPATSELEILEVAEYLSVAQLRRLLSRYVFDQSTVALPHEPDPLRPQPPSLEMATYGDRFRLHFECDQAAGALVSQAIREAKDSLFTTGNPDATLADGLLEVANRSLSDVDVTSRRAKYRVMIHLDTQGNGWLGKQDALPHHLLEQYTCDGVIIPVWETEGAPVNVGRAQRIVPERTRKLVEDRDRGCRFPGCTTTGFLECHHIHHWSQGGPTDIDALVSLCPFHHDAHHRGDFVITGTATGFDTLHFHTRHGHPIEPPHRQEPPPPPRLKPGPWNLDRGLRIDPTNIPLEPRTTRFAPPERTTLSVAVPMRC